MNFRLKPEQKKNNLSPDDSDVYSKLWSGGVNDY